MYRYAALLILAAALPAAIASAKNVDLVTLPRRDTVQLTIYNSEDLTLAKETRMVTLKKGTNKLQFSWAGTLIDPTSVELRPLARTDEINVVDTVYPGQKSQHLIWTIQSEMEGQLPVEVSYFTSGLTWQMDYVAIARADESALDFNGYVRVFNHSGEEYENAEIRLIVGKINLVEKIAELAKQLGQKGAEKTPEFANQFSRRAARFSFDVADAAKDSGAGKEIVKEGLSEYFMFSIEGTENIPNGWSKRMQAVTAEQVAFEIVYRLRTFQYGPRPVRFFTWRNNQEHHLGGSPLPDGLVRVFREHAGDGLSYLGQQALNYVPVQAEIEVNLGTDDLVVHQQRRTSTRRYNFAFHAQTNQVAGLDETQDLTDTIRNYRDKPIRFELRMRLGGDTEFAYQHPTRLFDYNTIDTALDVPARGQADYSYAVVIHHLGNARQNRVRLIIPQ